METIVPMNVIDIQLDKAAVRLRWDDSFQVSSSIGADRLVSWVAHLCALRWHSQSSWWRSTFTCQPLSLILLSSMCDHPLPCLFSPIYLCTSVMLHLLVTLFSITCISCVCSFAVPWCPLETRFPYSRSCVSLLSI